MNPYITQLLINGIRNDMKIMSSICGALAVTSSMLTEDSPTRQAIASYAALAMRFTMEAAEIVNKLENEES